MFVESRFSRGPEPHRGGILEHAAPMGLRIFMGTVEYKYNAPTGLKNCRVSDIITQPNPMELTVAITGASGTIYAYRVLQMLAESGVVETVNLIMSGTAATVAQVEMGVNLKDPTAATLNEWLGLPVDSKLIRYWRLDNLAAKPSSGSNKQAGMIVVPCSMGTLGAIASGAGTNLIHRAADVCLKEGRKLVLVPRETPYNAIHLENMLRLSQAGARILPASPGFYHRPQTIGELIDHLCYRILDQFDIPHSNKTRWTGDEVKDQNR